MRYYRCFLCIGQPTFPVSDKKDSFKESQIHYMTYHFKGETNATQERKTNS
jgi:hypothetical protein